MAAPGPPASWQPAMPRELGESSPAVYQSEPGAAGLADDLPAVPKSRRWLGRFASAERRESYRRMSGILKLERSGE